jgi:hypothetical protein
VAIVTHEDVEAVAVERHGQPVGREELPAEREIAVQILLGTEVQGQDLAGGVIDGAQQGEGGAAGFEPGEGAAIELDQAAGGQFAGAPGAMARGPAPAHRGAIEPEPEAPHGGPAHRQAMDLAQLLGEVDVVHPLVDGGHEVGDLRADGIGQPAGRGPAAAAVHEPAHAVGPEAGFEPLDVAEGQAEGFGGLPVGDEPGAYRPHEPGPGGFLAAHGHGLHEGMTFSLNSYPTTFSCSTGTFLVRP